MSSPLASFYHGKRVLLTGHTGFKGSWLTHWLEMMGAEVTGFSSNIPTNPSHYILTGLNRGENVFRDIRDRAALAEAVATTRPQIIFHLAAQPLVRQSLQEPLETVEVNILGTANVLDALRQAGRPCTLIVATSDKCYANTGAVWGYRECDPMGGHDPYSMTKGAAELVVASWRDSFFHELGVPVRVATARAGNVIGGGDWARDRLVVDCIAALAAGRPVALRNANATRPWQHVLEPLSGYLLLGERLATAEHPANFGQAWNFGPSTDGVRSVADLVDHVIAAMGHGDRIVAADPDAGLEASVLALNCDKAYHLLSWRPVWNFNEAVVNTVEWYRRWMDGNPQLREVTRGQIALYERDAAQRGLQWALAPSRPNH